MNLFVLTHALLQYVIEHKNFFSLLSGYAIKLSNLNYQICAIEGLDLSSVCCRRIVFI